MEQARRPVTGEVYHHFKDKLYEIITIAIHSETGDEMIVYRQLYGDYLTYVRPLSMFLSEVDYEKYPEVSQKYRFELVREVKKEEQVDPVLMEFLDARNSLEKLMVLEQAEAKGEISDKVIINMATSIDVVIEDGSAEQKLTHLKECLHTMAHFEGTRLR